MTKQFPERAKAADFDLSKREDWLRIGEAWRVAWAAENDPDSGEDADFGSLELEGLVLRMPALDWNGLSLKLEIIRDFPAGQLAEETWPVFEADIRRIVFGAREPLPCPLTATIEQLQELDRAYDRAELKGHGGDAVQHNMSQKATLNIWDKYRALEELATNVQAESAAGALLHVSLAFDALEYMCNLVSELDLDREYAIYQRRAERCLYSVRRFLVNAHGLNDAIAQGRMRGDLDPFLVAKQEAA